MNEQGQVPEQNSLGNAPSANTPSASAPSALDSLIETARILRAPGGCPWDAEQSHASLLQYLIEESYELVEAVETGDRAAVLEELGDVLYQVIFHCDLAASGSLGEPFDIQDVAAFTEGKMRGRHPHVFGSAEEKERFAAVTGDDVAANWDGHKAREKPQRESVLDGIPEKMPALMLAGKVLSKAEKLGIIDGASHEVAQDEYEFGALLLAMVQSGRSRGLDAERALRNTLRELSQEIRAFERGDEG